MIAEVRKLVKKLRPKGYVEALGFGMLTRRFPLARDPRTDNKLPFAPVASATQQNRFAFYLMGAYADSAADLG